MHLKCAIKNQNCLKYVFMWQWDLIVDYIETRMQLKYEIFSHIYAVLNYYKPLISRKNGYILWFGFGIFVLKNMLL